MENGTASNGLEFVEPEFWLKYSTVKERLDSLKRKNVPPERYNPVGICEEIGNILDYEEEENLSFLQNKIRKLTAGSELCKNICILQRHFSKLEINRAVSEILEEEKYEEIAYRIYTKKNLEARREKYFLEQALNTIKNSIEDERDEGEEDLAPNSVPEEVPATSPIVKNTKSASLHDPDINEHMDATVGNLNFTQSEKARDPENIDQLGLSKMSTGRPMTKLYDSEESFIPETETRQSVAGTDLMPHLEEIGEKEMGESLEKDITGEPEVPQPENDDTTLDMENLPPLVPRMPPHMRKRGRIRPVFDQSIVIRNYRERARRLNETVVVERVQVYEGPQSIIQSLMVNHLFETPAMNNRFSNFIRSSVLERLCKRHQLTEKRPNMDWDFPVWHSTVQETVQESFCHPFRPEAHQTSVLDITSMQPSLGENRESAVQLNGATEKELDNLAGLPVSKILQRTAPSPQVSIGPSNPWVPSRSPRIQNLQGRPIDPPISDPWFQPIQQSPPDEKWREFNYVRERLNEVWRENGTDKGADLRQLLGDEWNKENMLLLLRIVDKMSIKREVVLDGIGCDIIIRPFQIPYVTEKQYALRFHPPKY